MSKTIAISTGGGDAPGLNAVIRSAVLSAHQRNWKCIGIRNGFNGILSPNEFTRHGGGTMELTPDSVRGITHLGGTILGTTNKGNPLHYPIVNSDGTITEIDRTDEIISTFKSMGIDALISIGGDGSMEIAHILAKKGLQVIGVPKTIDNDLEKTIATFGFETAVEFATNCIDRLHSTAEAHERVMIVEVMGRYAGWIALHSGIAGTADCILLPEIPYDIDSIVNKIQDREHSGSHFSIIVIAEGALPKDGSVSVIGQTIGQAVRLGGAGEKLVKEIEHHTGKETRLVVLGHLQRGGMPTANDRLLALRFGASAVRAIADGHSDVMVALDPPYVNTVPLSEVTRRMKRVPIDSEIIQTARDIGISFGD
ncbi:MAG: ATP-dependent 6-phosphofructokinase [Ignavibacteriae bacterium]|jgi:phosphofructokinase-like protein|nr:ATP-dependent 6-phosphofructokinase [Ignavibacteriota bacterium]